MQLRLFVALILVLGALTQGTLAQPVSPDNAIAAAVPPRKVISWVAPYAIPQTKARLANLYGGVGPRNALTHLALQFWTPTKSGDKVARSTKYGAISNQTINGFVTWGHSNGIKFCSASTTARTAGTGRWCRQASSPRRAMPSSVP